MVDVDQEDPAPLTMYSITEHWGVFMEVAGLKAFNIHSIPEFVQLHLIESGSLFFFSLLALLMLAGLHLQCS